MMTHKIMPHPFSSNVKFGTARGRVFGDAGGDPSWPIGGQVAFFGVNGFWVAGRDGRGT